MELAVVPWSEAVRARVADALGPVRHWSVEQGRAMWREPTDGERWSRAIVLCDGPDPVAVASAFHPRVHSLREWVYVEVAAGRRGQGVGTRALAELRRRLPETARPLRAKVQAGSAGARFAARHGLALIQRSRLVRVTVPVGPVAADISVGDDLDDRVVGAWRDFYIAGHDWDPVGEVPFDVWRELTPHDGFAVRVTRDGRIAGIGFVTPEDGRPQFVGGAVARDDPDAPGIAERLLAGAAHRAGPDLVVELDDWMADVTSAVTALPHTVLDEGHIVAEPTP
jgi:GNAT superfamily N-acetyltransferase